MSFLPQIEDLRRRLAAYAMQKTLRADAARRANVQGIPRDAIRRILVCRPNHRLGNLLLLTPLLDEVQRVLPDAVVDLVLAGDCGREIFAGFANVGLVYSLSRRVVRHPFATVRIAGALRRARYDLAIDPCPASQSGRLLATLAGARYLVGAGGATAVATGSAGAAACAPPHAAQWPVYLIRRALAARPPGQHGEGYPDLDIRLSPAERQAAGKRIDAMLSAAGRPRGGVIVGLFAEATGAKRYGADWWRRFIAAVQASRPDFALVEVAPPDGRARLAGGLPSLCSPSPRAVAALIANMTCFVSGDCGVMHLASASGTPTFGLFSASDIGKYAPYGHGSRAFATVGKSPEDVARHVSGWAGTLPPRSTRVAGGNPTSGDGGPSVSAWGARIGECGLRT